MSRAVCWVVMKVAWVDSKTASDAKLWRLFTFGGYLHSCEALNPTTPPLFSLPEIALNVTRCIAIMFLLVSTHSVCGKKEPYCSNERF